MVKKKDFTSKDTAGLDIVGEITKATSVTTTETDSVKTGKKKKKKANSDLTESSPRFSARFNEKEWLYLEEKHWQTRKTYTELIRELVQADMEAHPEIVACIDELNGNNKNPFA